MNLDPGHNVYHNTIYPGYYTTQYLIQCVYNIIFIQCGSRVRRVVCVCVCVYLRHNGITKVPGVFYVPFWGRFGSHIRLHNGSKLFTMGFYYYLFFLKQPLILVRKKNSCVVKNNGHVFFRRIALSGGYTTALRHTENGDHTGGATSAAASYRYKHFQSLLRLKFAWFLHSKRVS